MLSTTDVEVQAQKAKCKYSQAYTIKHGSYYTNMCYICFSGKVKQKADQA